MLTVGRNFIGYGCCPMILRNFQCQPNETGILSRHLSFIALYSVLPSSTINNGNVVNSVYNYTQRTQANCYVIFPVVYLPLHNSVVWVNICSFLCTVCLEMSLSRYSRCVALFMLCVIPVSL